MRYLSALLLCAISYAQTTPATPATPAPTVILDAYLFAPTNPELSALSPAPVFAPVLNLLVYVQNAAVGMTYTFSIAGSTKNGASVSISGATNLVYPWVFITYQCQMGDTVTTAPTITLYGTVATATGTLIAN